MGNTPSSKVGLHLERYIIYRSILLSHDHKLTNHLTESRERQSLKNVKRVREDEQERVQSKEKKHHAHLRKQLIDDLQHDIHNFFEPLKEFTGITPLNSFFDIRNHLYYWTESLACQKQGFCTKAIVEEDDDEFGECWEEPRKATKTQSR